MKAFTLTLLMALGLFGCQTTAKVVHKRPNLRRIEAQVFTDEKNKLYIYIKKP